MKNIIPNVGSRLTYTISSIDIPKDKVPKEAVKHKLNKDRVFEIELFSQSEMRQLREDFYYNLQRRGVSATRKKIDEIFEDLMKRVANKIDTDGITKVGVGHVIGEDAHFGDGRDSQEWFFVIDWPKGNSIRERLGFSEADFHVTVGLTGNGVNEIRKDKETLLDGETAQENAVGMADILNLRNKKEKDG